MGLRRVQMLIDEDQERWLNEEAARLGVSKSEVVRRCLPAATPPEDGPAEDDGTWPPPDDPFVKFLEWVDQQDFPPGPTDVAEHHDTYLYGGEMQR
jgi:hypothetical protein